MKKLHVVAAIMMKNNKVLIAKRLLKGPLGGFWEFPGGKVENNETINSAIIREIKEEMGIDILPIKFIKSTNYKYDFANIKFDFIKCNILNDNFTLNAHSKYEFASEDEIHSYNLAPADIEIIKYIWK